MQGPQLRPARWIAGSPTRIRYERKAGNFLAFLTPGAALTSFKRLRMLAT